jgi:hypothetical protein
LNFLVESEVKENLNFYAVDNFFHTTSDPSAITAAFGSLGFEPRTSIRFAQKTGAPLIGAHSAARTQRRARRNFISIAENLPAGMLA